MAVPTAIDMVGSCRLGISSPESGLDVGGDVAVVDLGKLVVTGLSGRLLSEKTRRCSNGRDMGYYGGFLLDLTILLVVLGPPGFSPRRDGRYYRIGSLDARTHLAPA